MSKKKKLKGARDFGITVTYNKDLDKLSGVVLFPEKIEQYNKVLSNLTIRYANK